MSPTIIKASEYISQDFKKTEPSGQDKINGNPDTLREKIAILEKERYKITDDFKDKLLEVPAKTHISYVNKDGKYCSGGFLRIVEDDYFTLFASFPNGSKVSFCVQFDNVKTIYAKCSKEELVNEVRETTEEPTKFPVKIGDTVVKYCRDNWTAKRFIASGKYRQLERIYNRNN